MLGKIFSRKVILVVMSLVVIGAFVINSATMGYASGAGSLRTKSALKDGGRLDELATTMFGTGFSSEAGVALAHEKVFKVKAAAAFAEGRAIDIFKQDLVEAGAEFINKSGEIGITSYEVSKKLVSAQEFLKDKVFTEDFLNKIVNEIAKIDESKLEKDIADKKAKKNALTFLKTIKAIAAIQDEAQRYAQAKKALVDDTRFILFLFGEKGLEPSLFSVGNILSKEHRELISHIGAYPYAGSENIEGGPRTVYLTLARITGLQELGQQGLEATQEMMLHEFLDMANGRHVEPNSKVKAKLTKINEAIDKKYREVEKAIVTEVTEEGPVVASNDKVVIEKYRLTDDLRRKDTFAIKGSSKVHPGVPKGQLLTITIAKADTGSTGGHGTAPGKMLEAVAEEWMGAAERGEIADFFITRVGDDISVIVTHNKGKDSEAIHKHIWDGFMRSSVVAKDLGYYGAGQDMLAEAFSGNVRGAGPSVAEMVIKEQASEVVIFAQADKTAPGAFNRGLWNILFGPDTTWRPLGPGEAENIQAGMLDFDYNNNAGRHIWLTKKDYDDAYWYGGYPDRYTYDLVKLGNGEEMAAVTAQRLGIIAGEYVGKDDPMFMIRSQKKFPAVGEITSAFLKGEYIVPGWMRGSNKGPFFPVALTDSKIGIYDGPPLLSMWSFNLNNGRLEGFYDLMAANPAIRYIQDRRAAAAVRQLEEGFHEMGLRLGPEEIEYQKGPKLIEERLKDKWEVYEAKKDGGAQKAEAEQKEADKKWDAVAQHTAATKTQDTTNIFLESTWGKNLAVFAKAFPGDINYNVPSEVRNLLSNKVILIEHDSLLRSPDGIMALENLFEQGIKPVLHINRDEIDGRNIKEISQGELNKIVDEDFAKINEINGGYTKISRDMFRAVVVGTDPTAVANEITAILSADIYQVIGPESYVEQFKDTARDTVRVRLVLDKANKGQLTLMSKALKLGLELIPVDGKLSNEDLKKIDALFSVDAAGNFHVAPANVVGNVETIADKYEKEVEASVRI